MTINRIAGALDREMVENSNLPPDMIEQILLSTRDITSVTTRNADAGTPMESVLMYMGLLTTATGNFDGARYYVMSMNTREGYLMGNLLAIIGQYMIAERKFERASIIRKTMLHIADNMHPGGVGSYLIHGDIKDIPHQIRILKIILHSMNHVYIEST